MEERIYPPGTRLAGYEVLSHLATGSETVVYVAKDLSPEAERRAPVALKVCRFNPRTLPRAYFARFNDRHAREFTLLARLWNRNIVHVFEQRFHEGLIFFSLELLDGPTLGEWWAAERRTFLEVLRVYRQLVGAVAYAHGRGLVHRDLKPSNVRVMSPRVVPWNVAEWDAPEEAEDGEALRFLAHSRAQPVLVDFSVAQSLSLAPITLPGALVGTAEYLSPEYARYALAREDAPYRATPAEDVYQMGILLYLLLTGRHPVQTPAGQLWELFEEIRDVTPPAPREVNPDAPRALSALCEACLAKHPHQRPADGVGLQALLVKAMQQDAAALSAPAPLPGEFGETAISVQRTGRDGNEERKPSRSKWRQIGRVLGVAALLLVVFGLGVLAHGLKVHTEPSTGVIASHEPARSQEPINAPQTPPVADAALAGRPMPASPEPSWMRCPKDCGYGEFKKCVMSGNIQFTLVGYRGTCWTKGRNLGWSPDPAQRRKCKGDEAYDPPPDAPEELLKLCFQPLLQEPGQPNAVEP